MTFTKWNALNMKKTIIITTVFFVFCSSLSAQSAISGGSIPISQQLYSFSPLARIFLKHFGLEDKNNNGVIDKGADEGYEGFIAKYGNADVGFHANSVMYGANNEQLEEPEIINHYYINIRFKQQFEKETSAIENEVKTYIYANNLPLIWLDDEQGTVMKTVNRILGEGWQNKKVPESEAERMFNQVMSVLNIQSLPGKPIASGYGYKQLSDFINHREGYCFEVAQFGFWFFSQLKIKSIDVETALEQKLLHGVIKLPDNNILIDYFGTSNGYNISANQWEIHNPLQCISDYYYVQACTGKTGSIIEYYKQAVIYNKYNIETTGFLMENYSNSNNPNHREIIALGEFILQNTDISRLMNSTVVNIIITKDNLKAILSMLVKSYSSMRNRYGFEIAVNLLNQYFRNESNVQQIIEYYKAVLE